MKNMHTIVGVMFTYLRLYNEPAYFVFLQGFAAYAMRVTDTIELSSRNGPLIL